jgi:hypothetical protein
MSSSSIAYTSLYANAITEKLTKANHVMWKAQVLAVLCGAWLVGHVTGVTKAPAQEVDGKVNDKPVKLPNVAYDEWYASDQHVLRFLLSSLSKEVLPQVATKGTTADAWNEIQNMFGWQAWARTVNTRVQLATTQKGNSMVAEYINKMWSLGNMMAVAGRTLDEEELVEYILTGLNDKYDPIVYDVIARESPVSLSELYAQLLAFETCLALMGAHEGGGSSANSASCGRGGTGRGSGRDSSTRGGYNSGRCGHGGFDHGGYNSSNDKCPLC